MSQRYMVMRNKIYCFRQRVPKDLKHLFPVLTIIRSLKTRDVKAAKLLLHTVQGKLETVFALLRTGFLNDEQTRIVVDALLNDERKTHLTEAKSVKINVQLLSNVIKLYIQEHKPFWSGKTPMENQCQLEILLRLMGNREVTAYDREACINCRDTLMKLPPNFNKLNKYKGKSLSEIMQIPNNQVMHPVTVNGYMVMLSSLFKWAVQRDYISRNPAEGLQMKIHRKADEERKLYSHDDLQLIVDNLERSPKHPERYWIPLIALHSGMRLDEICQLTVDDIHEIGKVICFDVNDIGEKKLKTPSSHRLIPVHPMLLQLGLMKYVESQQAGKKLQLWTNLERDKFGYWSGSYSKWYTRFNRGYITKDPKKCFHSFRHTMADSLKQLDLQETIIAEILGHANENISTGRYGKPFHPDRLLDAISKVDYGIKFPDKDFGP